MRVALVSGEDSGFLWCHAEQTACPGILEHPQRAIGSDLYVADSVTNVPAFGGRRAALTIEGNAVERLGRQAANAESCRVAGWDPEPASCADDRQR